jgi:glyoxylase-like metal-dependent hydrolase (beta-lactamase superfamily II)
MIKFGLAAALLAAVGPGAANKAEPYHLIPGRVPLDWQGPDGNTIVFDAPRGLIVVDTGRSPMHAQAILDHARARGRPIAAILNTHWHLDHTTGNADLRAAYPEAEVYATTAIEGALVGFLGRNREQANKMLADPKVPEGQKAQMLRGRDRIDNPDKLRPTRPVLQSARMSIAGRTFDVRVAPFAASEADIWLYDPKTKVAVVGDLVVDIVPFMDSACPDGWARALDEVQKVPFRTLIPGHGAPMTRVDFLQWKTAYNKLLACGRSRADKKQCAANWQKDAARFIGEAHRQYAGQAAEYYIDTRLRSSPEEQQRFCKPLKAGS